MTHNPAVVQLVRHTFKAARKSDANHASGRDSWQFKKIMHSLDHTTHDTQVCSQCVTHSERHHSLTQTVNVYDNNERPYPKVLELQTERTADAEGRGVGSCCLAWPSGQPGLS